MRSFFIGLFFCGTAVFGLAQSTAFGIKGGLTAGRQRWDNTFERDMLLRYHGIAFIESASEDSRFALFAQGGYHIKGSAIRTPRSAVTGSGGTIFDVPNEYDIYTIYYPIPGFVRKLNYGITMGGGIEIPFDELVGVLVEFTVNPDFSYQYDQPPLENIINPNPWAPRGNISLPQRRSTNLTFELSFGFRFLRKVIYID
ncbi:MAG: hypothetical protein IPO07_23060 [Haliscomenobacter sp.]|nr:hypothetical protein [Haliscomenobacter sp.]MBK9491348.1 hypothetical protein [Haliscomenobacter sp.]